MRELDRTTILYGPATSEASDGRFALACVLRQRNQEVILQLPSGLVVSSDEEVRSKLGEILRQCGLAPVFASTVSEGGMALAGNEVFLVLCDDCLSDGKYLDIVKLAGRSDSRVPVVVVSRTGEWPEYLTAIAAGVFDYLAYPPVAGELRRIIQNAFRECVRQRCREGTAVL